MNTQALSSLITFLKRIRNNMRSRRKGNPLIAAVLLLFAGATYVYNTYDIFDPSTVKVFPEEDLVTVTSKDMYFEYDIDSAEYEYRYRVIAVHPAQKTSRALGAAYEISLVTDDWYREFEALTARGQCPANFLNSKAESFLVIPDSKSTKDKIAKKNYQTGDVFSLSGRPLRVNYAEHKGRALDSFTLSGTELMLATDVL